MKTAVCCIVRNEENDIGEWIAFHIGIGFDCVIVYDNCSEDSTAEIARSFGRRFDVRVIRWDVKDDHWQNLAYFNAILRHHAEFDWILFIDSDEFFLILPRGRNLGAFLADFDDNVGQILINWAMFGSAGHITRPDGLVIEEFTRRMALDNPVNAHTKAFVRTAKVVGIVNCHCFNVEGKSVDVLGNDVVWSKTSGAGLVDGPPRNEVVRINHYWTKSRDQFFNKMSRGYKDKTVRKEKDFYDFEAGCLFDDDSAKEYGDGVRAIQRQLSYEGALGAFPSKGSPAQMRSAEYVTLKIVDFAIGDVLCSFPCLYQKAESESLRLWFQNPRIRQLWAGPNVEMLDREPDDGVVADISESHKFFVSSGLHMIQAWFWRLGLPVPRTIPKIDLNVVFHDSVDVLISPFSASGALGGRSKVWSYEGWNKVIDALFGAGLTVGVCGVFSEGADPRSFDQRFWGDRQVVELNALPLVDLAGHLSSARCVVTVDNGIGHLAHLLGVPHAHVIPYDVNLCPPEWVANQNSNAVWICEPFVSMDERADVLEAERVLEVIFAVLASFNRAAYLRENFDVGTAGDDPWTHWVHHGKRENRSSGFRPTKARFGDFWAS